VVRASSDSASAFDGVSMAHALRAWEDGGARGLCWLHRAILGGLGFVCVPRHRSAAQHSRSLAAAFGLSVFMPSWKLEKRSCESKQKRRVS